MYWVRENLWGPGAASPLLGIKDGVVVSLTLNFGIGGISAGKNYLRGQKTIAHKEIVSRDLDDTYCNIYIYIY